jgi:hypothetical protein
LRLFATISPEEVRVTHYLFIWQNPSNALTWEQQSFTKRRDEDETENFGRPGTARDCEHDAGSMQTGPNRSAATGSADGSPTGSADGSPASRTDRSPTRTD